MHIILASQSPYRKLQLENFGLHFEAIKPLVNETELKTIGPSSLEELTVFLAKSKAESLAKLHRQALVIGSDQIAEIDGQRLDKPETLERAKAQLKKLSGRTHRLITSIAVLYNGVSLTFSDITEIELHKLDEETIETYLQVDQPLDCAGSYKIEKAGLALVKNLHSRDPSAIQGLPMLSLMKAFSELKIPISQLWRPT